MAKSLMFELIKEPIRPTVTWQCIGEVSTGRNKSRRCRNTADSLLLPIELPWRCHQHKLSIRE